MQKSLVCRLSVIGCLVETSNCRHLVNHGPLTFRLYNIALDWLSVGGILFLFSVV